MEHQPLLVQQQYQQYQYYQKEQQYQQQCQQQYQQQYQYLKTSKYIGVVINVATLAMMILMHCVELFLLKPSLWLSSFIIS